MGGGVGAHRPTGDHGMPVAGSMTSEAVCDGASIFVDTA